MKSEDYIKKEKKKIFWSILALIKWSLNFSRGDPHNPQQPDALTDGFTARRKNLSGGTEIIFGVPRLVSLIDYSRSKDRSMAGQDLGHKSDLNTPTLKGGDPSISIPIINWSPGFRPQAPCMKLNTAKEP